MSATKTSFHVSNYGQFGASLPRDLDGYCHLTAAEWMAAPIDFGGETMDGDDLAEWAGERAALARAAVSEVDAALAEWQDGRGA